MAYDQNKVRILYKKLLNFYPREFKEQLGESMQQTFNDLYNEKKYKTKRGLFSFVLWTFIETAIGIVQEYILLIKEMNYMKNILTNLRSPAIIGLLFVIPFMIMEVVNTQNFNAVFNIPLFGIMWLLPTIFIIILVPIVQNIQAGNSLMANPISLLLRIVFSLFIAWFWIGLVMDQMPCFLGVPNCD